MSPLETHIQLELEFMQYPHEHHVHEDINQIKELILIKFNLSIPFSILLWKIKKQNKTLITHNIYC